MEVRPPVGAPVVCTRHHKAAGWCGTVVSHCSAVFPDYVNVDFPPTPGGRRRTTHRYMVPWAHLEPAERS